MKMRRIIAAAVSAIALIAVNVGVAESASAGSSWSVDGKTQTQKQLRGSSWS
jgi:hypothetical protein